MSTNYVYYSYLQTEDKKINLTAYSDNDIGINIGIQGTRYAKLLKDVLKQVTTLPWHFTPKGALFGPIYGIYVG